MELVGTFNNRRLRHHLPDVYHTTLVLALGRREVGNCGKLPTIAKRTRSRPTKPLWGLLEQQSSASVTREPWGIEDIRSFWLWSGSCLFCWRLVRRVGGMNANGSVKEGSGEQVGVSRTPVDLECPIFRRRKLTGYQRLPLFLWTIGHTSPMISEV